MKKLRNYVGASSGFLLVVGVIALSIPQTGRGTVAANEAKENLVANAPPPVALPVTVQNTPSVTVSNTPMVNAQQSGPWNVGITGTPTVSVAGTVPVVAAIQRDRFSAQAELDIGEGSGNTCNNCDDAVMVDVPDGKVAVIEHVSVQGRSTPGAVFDVILSTFGGSHYIEMAYLDTDSFNRKVYVGSHPITLYGPFIPGSNREVIAQAFSIGGLAPPYRATFRVRITGYYVDAPPAP